MAGDYVFVAAGNRVLGFHRGKQVLRMPEAAGQITHLLHLSTMMIAISSAPARLHVFHIAQEELIGSLDLSDGGDVTAILHPSTWLNKVIVGRENGVVQVWNIRVGYDS
jgi:U3 small nucleolar RNA-associated protein 21